MDAVFLWKLINNLNDMASSSSRVARIDVLIGGVDQAKNQVAEMKTKAAELTTQLEAAKSQMDKLADVKGTDAASAYDKAKEAVKRLETELGALNKSIRTSEQNIKTVGEYLNDVSGQSIRNLNTSAKALKQMQSSADPRTQKDALNTVNEMLKKVTDEIARRKGTIKEFEDVIGEIGTVSDKSLGQARSRLEELIATAEKGSSEMATLKSQLNQVVNEQNTRKNDQANALGKQVNGGTASENQIKQYIQLQKELQGTVTAGSDLWKTYANNINVAEDKLAEFQGQMKDDTMSAQLTRVSSLTSSALTEQKKYWQAQVEGAQNAGKSVTVYQQNLDKVIQEEQNRVKTAGVEAMQRIDQMNSGTWDAQVQDIQKLRTSLEAYKKTLKLDGQAIEIENVNKKLRELEQAERKASSTTVDMKRVMDNLKTVPYKDLKLAAEQLQKQLEQSERGTKKYVETTGKLREVNKQIKATEAAWKGQDGALKSVIKRLTAYVAVYGSFNFIKGQISGILSGNMQLSDSMSDIQKTTGLTRQEVDELGKSIDRIDTRTSQEELYQLASSAGRLGLKSSEDVLGFTKAANMLKVALVELGDDGPNTLMKLSALMGDMQKMGVEKSLIAIGSSINELSIASAATSDHIVDFMSRVGGIAASSKIGSQDVAAIGATFDALGQSMEVAGTSMNKFIASVMSSPDKVAYALNLDAKAMHDLIDQGKTMDVIVQTFQKMNSMGGIDALKPIMGDLGSDGARMISTLTAMAQHVDVLEQQLAVSRKGFREATSVVNEYNVKNNNAIALWQRLKNEISEMVINTGVVEWLTGVVKGLKDFVEWVTSGSAGAKAFRIIMETLLIELALVKTGLTKLVAALFTAEDGTKKLGAAFTNLGKALKSNWISLLISALAALAINLWDVVTAVGEVSKATGKANSEMQEEEMQITRLFNKLSNLSASEAERAEAMKKINDRYSSYLGFMVSDLDSTEKLTRAKELLIAQLEKERSLKMKDTLVDAANNQVADDISKANEGLANAINKNSKIGSDQKQNAIADISKKIMELVADTDKNQTQINQELNMYLNKTYHTVDEDIRMYSARLVKYYRKNREALDVIDAQTEARQKAAAQNEQKATVKMLNEFHKEWAQEIAISEQGMDDDARNEHRDKLEQIANNYNSLLQKESENLSEAQRTSAENSIKNMQTQLVKFNRGIENIAQQAVTATNDAWGKGLNLGSWKDTLDNLKTASVDSLVSTYKSMKNDSKMISDVVKYNAMMGTSFSSLSEAMEDTHKKAEEIKNELASRGRTVTGNFLFGGSGKSGGGKSGKNKELKEQMEAAMSALEKYFLDRQTEIKQAQESEEITEAEANRRLESNEFEHLNARIKLRRDFLGQEGGLVEEEQKLYGLENVNLQKLSQQLMAKGKAMQQGVERKMAEDNLKVQTLLLKHKKAMEKILLAENPTEQVIEQWQETIDKLDLLFGPAEESDEKLARLRIRLLKEWAEESATLTADELKDRIAKEESFSEWRVRREDEDYAVLLSKLRDFNDAYADAENRAADKQKKLAEKRWKKSGNSERLDRNTKAYEEDASMYEKANSLGLASDSMMYQAQINAYQAKVDASKAYLAQLEKETQVAVDSAKAQLDALKAVADGEELTTEDRAELADAEIAYQSAVREQEYATLEARKDVAEQMKNLSDKEAEIQESKLNKLKEYTDAVVDFAGEMGEAAFSEVDDRKEAAKTLLKTTMNLVKEEIMQYTKKMLMKKLLASQEVATAQSTSQQETAIEGQQMISSLTATAAETTADVNAGIASGAAKTIGKLGWWGIPLVAVITAALNGLLSLAMSALTKSKSEVSSATGTSSGKVAAGMLTYADGKYPVLGNDGEVYEAKYESRLKTGVYTGGPRFAIFSEKKPEMVVDGNTTEQLMLNEPEVYQHIMDLANHRRRQRALPTYAEGYYPAMVPTGNDASGGTDTAGTDASTQRMLAQVGAALSLLTERLNEPITASVDPYGKKGAVNQLNKAQKFMQRRGLSK
jgi:hypothetical protein